jgi:DNA-binding winged helix-turn-helix (wHTH) protein
MSTAHNEILRFGTFEVDLRSGELRKQGVRVKLQDQPFQVLRLLLQRAGELVTREELRAQIWPADTFVDFDNSLNAANKLREAWVTRHRSSGWRNYVVTGKKPAAFRHSMVNC